MKNILGVFLCTLLLWGGTVLPAGAEGVKRGWEVDLSKLAFDFNSTEVKNAAAYQDFSQARLTADSQTAVRGLLNASADYHARHYLWSNELLLDYGRTKLRPVDDETIVNENADQILFTTGYTQRLWNIPNLLGGFEMGPFANLGYETEFTKPEDAPRKRVLRATAGVKLFEGKYLKSLFAAVVGERDYTYSPTSNKLAWEAGFKIEQPLREGVKAQYEVLFRDYLSESERVQTDLDYEFSADARLEVQLYKNLYLAPFVSYYTAQAKYFGKRGENVYVGVSLSFSHLFKAAEVVEQ